MRVAPLHRQVRSLLLALVASVALTIGGCGYRLVTSPPLPGGLTSLTVPVLENDTTETEAGVVMAVAVARRAEADGRLAARGGAEARLLGRVELIRTAPAAFPGGLQGAGMYAMTVRVRLRLMPSDGGPALAEIVVSGRESYLAGRDPEETEALRRLAFERLADRLADEAWRRLTAPRD